MNLLSAFASFTHSSIQEVVAKHLPTVCPELGRGQSGTLLLPGEALVGGKDRLRGGVSEL